MPEERIMLTVVMLNLIVNPVVDVLCSTESPDLRKAGRRPMTYPVSSKFVSLVRSGLFHSTNIHLLLFIADARKGYVCDIKYPIRLFRREILEQQESEDLASDWWYP